MKCRACRKAELSSRRENYHYAELGLANVTLADVEVRQCPSCGARTVVVPRPEELHRELAFAVAAQRARLNGAEIRFLRKYLGWSGADFAAAVGVDASTVSNWENDKVAVGPQSDRLLRALVFRLKPVEEYPNERFADVAQDVPAPRFMVTGSKTSWHAEEATV